MARRADASNLVRLTRAGLAKLTLEPGQRDRTWWDTETPGFGYRLRGDRGSWVIRPPRAGGSSSLVTLASAALMDVGDARKLAREKLAKADLGDNPRAARRAERVSRTEAEAPVTVGEVFRRYTLDAEGRMRASTLANLRTHLGKHWQGLHDMPLISVRRADVAEHLRAITKDGGRGAQAALRARRTLSTVFVWAIGEGLTESNPVIGTNPPAVEVRRERVLSDVELAAVLRACPPVDDFGRIVHLLALTGARRDEVAAMAWSEIDEAGMIWRLPGERSKNKRHHSVPLSSAALAVIASAPRIEGRAFLFGSGTGPFSGFSRAKARLDGRVSFAEPWRLHDIRRTVATGMQGLGVPVEVIERTINHQSGVFRGIVGVYQRHDYLEERRVALSRWAEHVRTLLHTSL